jgi:heme-degrading monooxygenase HmoA
MTIARIWHGWTTHENAQPYEDLLQTKVLPEIDRVDGYRGAFLLRRHLEDSVEFATITFFDSMDAVKAFAGDDYELAVIDPEGRSFLERFDERSLHYETIRSPD